MRVLNSVKFGLALFVLLFGMQAVANPANGNASVYTEDKTAVIVTADKTEFVIKLKSNPTTGYSWFLRDYDADMLEPVSHVFEAPANKKLMGAPGYQLWTFRAKSEAFIVPQETMIRFVYIRPWEAVDGSKQVVFSVVTH